MLYLGLPCPGRCTVSPRHPPTSHPSRALHWAPPRRSRRRRDRGRPEAYDYSGATSSSTTTTRGQTMATDNTFFDARTTFCVVVKGDHSSDFSPSISVYLERPLQTARSSRDEREGGEGFFPPFLLLRGLIYANERRRRRREETPCSLR